MAAGSPEEPSPTVARSSAAEAHAWLADVVGADIDSVEQLSGGASRETFRVTAGDRQFVLQRQRPGNERSLVAEAGLIRLASEHGVPVPHVVAAGHAPDGPDFLVSVAVPGETIARRILRDDAFVKARRRLASQLGAALAALHTIDPTLAAPLAHVEALQACRDRTDELGVVNPVFELAFRWLADRRPPRRPATIVHGDFRLGNLIVDGEGLAAVIDWELAHLGDPMEDLGWLSSRAWRFGGDRPVAGVGEYAELLGVYCGGEGGITLEELHWWRVLSTLRWGAICAEQVHTHLAGIVRSHELAAIGRRVSQTEHDLLAELELG